MPIHTLDNKEQLAESWVQVDPASFQRDDEVYIMWREHIALDQPPCIRVAGPHKVLYAAKQPQGWDVVLTNGYNQFAWEKDFYIARGEHSDVPRQ